MKKSSNNLIPALMIALASLLPIKKAEAGITGSVEYIQSEHHENSYARASASYSLPLNVSGFTFSEFYKAEEGYYGITYLEKPVTGNLNARLRLQHDNDPLSQIVVGTSFNIPWVPKEAFAQVYYDALWFSPKGFRLKAFGEWNLSDRNGVTWNYGEVSIGKRFGPFTFSYNPSLNPQNGNKLIPELEHRVSAKVNF
ncbi:hypothetical protein HYT23_00935 [Candidatus Pacearchaeota archaeon]|nr:hypothetical protein [Candidatus Pacearchaeota archaeon]